MNKGEEVVWKRWFREWVDVLTQIKLSDKTTRNFVMKVHFQCSFTMLTSEFPRVFVTLLPDEEKVTHAYVILNSTCWDEFARGPFPMLYEFGPMIVERLRSKWNLNIPLIKLEEHFGHTRVSNDYFIVTFDWGRNESAKSFIVMTIQLESRKNSPIVAHLTSK
jgi:hypothetical protein